MTHGTLPGQGTRERERHAAVGLAVGVALIVGDAGDVVVIVVIVVIVVVAALIVPVLVFGLVLKTQVEQN
jgi:Flp pilus assembly protein TadB